MPEARWWHCRATRDDGGVAWFALVRSERYADSEVVEAPEVEALGLIGEDPASFADLDADGRVERVRLRGDVRSRIPGVWFAEISEPGATPPASTLVAFEGHGVRTGDVRRGEVPGEPPVTSVDQLAAVRWFPASGEVDQIYVAPTARRQRVATALVSTMAVLCAARGQPRPWGDGRRTDLGEAWVGAQEWRSLAAPRTHVAPPMTPGDAGA